MKKMIITIILIMCFLVNINVYADNSDVSVYKDELIRLNILDEDDFSNSDTITRGDCLIAIIRAIGITDNDISRFDGADFMPFVDTASFSYFGYAYMAEIAYGEKCVVDYPTYRSTHMRTNWDYFFFPERAVTVKETLAFMVRCLEKERNESLEYAIEKAEEYGLIKDNDTFIDKSDSTLSQDDFYVLLNRFLQQKRYKYYDSLGSVGIEVYFDEDRSISYFEMLEQRID